MSRKIIIIEDEQIERDRLRVAFLGLPVTLVEFSSYSAFFEAMAPALPLSSDDVLVVDCNIEDDGNLSDSLECEPFWRRRLATIRCGQMILHTGQSSVARERDALERLGYHQKNIHHVLKGDFDALIRLSMQRDDSSAVGQISQPGDEKGDSL
jgi:hypothetical protein